MNNFPCPLLHKWMMTSPLIIQWCCINLTAEYPHFFLGHHPLILLVSSPFPLSLPHKFHHIPWKKMVLYSWPQQRQHELAMPSRSRSAWEWESAGCHWRSRQPRGSAAAQQPRRPPQRTLPEASHSMAFEEDSPNTSVAFQALPCFLSLQKSCIFICFWFYFPALNVNSVTAGPLSYSLLHWGDST